MSASNANYPTGRTFCLRETPRRFFFRYETIVNVHVISAIKRRGGKGPPPGEQVDCKVLAPWDWKIAKAECETRKRRGELGKDKHSDIT